MARPRFAKLAPEQQERILSAALAEFASRGFADASLNRIIENAGISKGSMYYYFDSKEELYSHVIRQQLESLIDRAGPFAVPVTSDPDEFWEELTVGYLRLMHALLDSPEASALLRGWLSGGASPALQGAQQDAEREVMPWVVRAIGSGQQIGAIRTDLPAEVLIAVTMGMGQAIDVWLITGPVGDADLESAVRALLGMMRRALAP